VLQLKTASEKLLNGIPFLPASREDTEKELSREDTETVLKENQYDFSDVVCLACAFQPCGSLAGNVEAGLAEVQLLHCVLLDPYM